MQFRKENQDTEKSRDNKIIATVLLFVALAFSIVLISYFGNRITSGAKAFVAGEGYWTKAQKESVLHLIRYLDNENPKHYKEFEQALQVNKGDQIARRTLLSDEPDYDLAYQGFLKGKNHPNDIPDMIWLFNNFKNISHIKNAIEIWTEADTKIAELDSLAQAIHSNFQDGDVNAELKDKFINDIYELDSELTVMESAFSRQMGLAARWASSRIFWLTVVIVLSLVLIAGITTIRNLKNISTVNQKLDSTQRKFRNVLENSRDVIYQMDLNTGNYVYMSPFVEEMLGYTPEEMLEKGPEFVINNIHPDDQKRMENELADYEKDDLQERFKKDTEFRIKTHSGEYIWVSNKRALVLDSDGEPSEIVGSVRDITDRKKNEEEIDRSLREKEVLLQEIHHRVKNNLAIVVSLLELQKSELNDDMQVVFQDCQSRIQSIALVHEKLYQNDTLSNINIGNYIRELTDVISSAYNIEKQNWTTQLLVDSEDLSLNINQAIPIGLIYNELLNNVYKHGFEDGKKGMLKVELEYDGDIISLSVEDNGKGLPDDFNVKDGGSLGMTLVDTLSQQLEADLSIESNEWTKFEISFKP